MSVLKTEKVLVEKLVISTQYWISASLSAKQPQQTEQWGYTQNNNWVCMTWLAFCSFSREMHHFTQTKNPWNVNAAEWPFASITIGLFLLGYLRYDGRFVSVAGDEDYERPVIWVHEDTSCLSAGGVKRRGAAPMGALDTAALHLPLHPFPAVRTLLPEWQSRERGEGIGVKRKSYKWQVKVKEVHGKERRRKETSQEGRMRGRKKKK